MAGLVKSAVRKAVERLAVRCIKSAARQQGLSRIVADLENIVPDISGQYSSRRLDSDYLVAKVRTQHAFQMSLVAKVIDEFKDPVIVDIGDSSGTHLKYIKGLYPEKSGMRCLSVNLDEEAVKRIRASGIEAVKARAENVAEYNIDPDIFLSFQMLEHMMDPCNFLHALSRDTKAGYLVITVPYLRRSRVGLHHIRDGSKAIVNAETTHIFELDPEDWKLIALHSGWSVTIEKIYLQYPKFSLFRAAAPLWRKFDFEGFYGMVLKRDDKWSSRYSDWQGYKER